MKIFLVALGLSLLVIPSCVDAAALAQRGDTDIFFTQSEITDNRRQYFEFQRIVNYNDKDVNLLHLRIKGENFASAKLVHEASGTIIPLEQVEINHDFVLPADRIDKWYKYDNIAWQKIAQYIADQGTVKEKDKFVRVKCDLTLVNGNIRHESFRINAEDVVNTATASHAMLKEKAQKLVAAAKLEKFQYTRYYLKNYYQPDVQIFFPGKTYKEVKERFCYNLNRHDKKGKVMIFGYGNGYCFNDKMMAVVPLLQFNISSMMWFNEKPEGTWLNWNRFTYTDKYGNICEDYKFNQDLLDIIAQTYTEMYGMRDYGFEVKKYNYLDNKIKIKSVGNNPELKPINDALANKELVRVIGINGKKDNFTALFYDIRTKYQPNGTPITFTFVVNKTNQEYNITITPKIIPMPESGIDYAAYNAVHDELIVERKNPWDYGYDGEPFLEIYDPYTSHNEPLKYQF